MKVIYIWLGIALILAAIEVATLSFTTIWFVASGLLAMVISFFTDIFLIQFAVFVIVGIVLLATTRPMIKKFFKKNDTKTNADRIIGMEGIVTEKISKNQDGVVKVDGKEWTAFADSVIAVSSTVLVLEIKGVKIKVRKVDVK
ncbi:MAG: NfeD family protein [Bacilli bacterium]